MPLKCQDPDTGAHTCTTAHSHRHMCAHRHAHVQALTHRHSYRNLGVHAHSANCRSARPPGPGRWAQISLRGALRPVWGRFLQKLTEMPVTQVTRLLEEGGAAPRRGQRALAPRRGRRALAQAGKDPASLHVRLPIWTVPRPASTESGDDCPPRRKTLC